jgi:hypothetical protein
MNDLPTPGVLLSLRMSGIAATIWPSYGINRFCSERAERAVEVGGSANAHPRDGRLHA